VLKEVRATPGVTRASPLIEQPLLGSFNGRVDAIFARQHAGRYRRIAPEG
jgi:lipoprotein-releasing system permease protein